MTEKRDIIELIYIARGSDLPRTSTDLAIEERDVTSPAQKAFEKISEMYKSMIDSLASTFLSSGMEIDDLRQEGLMGLYKAVMLYDPRYSSFTTFAYICIKRSMISAYREFKKADPSMTSPLSDDFSDPDEDEGENGFVYHDNSNNPELLFLDKEASEQIYKKIDMLLSPMENKVLRLFIKGESYESIAETLGITKKSADNALKRARNKLKGLLK